MATMEQQVETIVDTILEDYRNGRSIDRMSPFAHPDKAVVIDMIEKLMRIVEFGPPGRSAFQSGLHSPAPQSGCSPPGCGPGR